MSDRARIESGLKIILLTIVLAGASWAQPSFAKEARAHHAGAAKDTAGKNATRPNSLDAKPSDTLDAGVTALPPRLGVTPAKARNANTGMKLAKPANFQARRAAERSNPVVRNAIGQSITEQGPAVGAMHSGAVMQRPAAVSGGNAAPANFARASGEPDSARQSPHTIATASIVNRGKIDGTGLVRPAVAPSSLGGPAKAAAGINGTTLRPKR